MAEQGRPLSIVVFGASGDLARRKLIPALYALWLRGRLPGRLAIVGFSRTDYSHDAFRDHLQPGVQEAIGEGFDPQSWARFAEHLWYSRGDSQVAADVRRLQDFLRDREGGPADRLYYMATAPALFPVIAGQLSGLGMAAEDEGWRRVVVEKPFGSDLASARRLDQQLHACFAERQIYRMDHYLGKETAQNVFFLRFANAIFEPLWNRNYVANVQISVLEDEPVGRRAAYYEQAGVFRDMFQNHLLQLLCLVAMEPPVSLAADVVRDEKAKVLAAIPPIDPEDVVQAQYDGYQQEPGVAAGTRAPTYGALKLYVDNWRWQGVPFYLRSGKALGRRCSEIDVEFRCPPNWMLGLPPHSPNILSICIQPDEGLHLKLQAKVPDVPAETRTVDLEFHYRDHFCCGPLPDAYERLLQDVIAGDASLFPRSDAIEESWRLIDGVQAGLAQAPLARYPRGLAGPEQAELLVARDDTCWHLGCIHD